MTTTCATCRHGAESSDVPDDFLQCRRHAPTLPPVGASGDGLDWLAVWPAVHCSNWCGDWSPATTPHRVDAMDFNPDALHSGDLRGDEIEPGDIGTVIPPAVGSQEQVFTPEGLRDFLQSLGLDTGTAGASSPSPTTYDDTAP